MAEKVTVMVLKVDLQCPSCYKKVKKILCKFPQIRDQVYNEKANTVTITVVCCDPEKIRDKLCRKGANVIISIEIREPPKPTPPKETEKPKPPTKPSEPEKPKPPQDPPPPRPCCCRPCSGGCGPCPGGCRPCSGGCGGRPCRCNCGFVVVRPPPLFWCPCGCGFHGRPCHVSGCGFCFCEENSQACSIM